MLLLLGAYKTSCLTFIITHFQRYCNFYLDICISVRLHISQIEGRMLRGLSVQHKAYDLTHLNYRTHESLATRHAISKDGSPISDLGLECMNILSPGKFAKLLTDKPQESVLLDSAFFYVLLFMYFNSVNQLN